MKRKIEERTTKYDANNKKSPVLKSVKNLNEKPKKKTKSKPKKVVGNGNTKEKGTSTEEGNA